MQNNFDNYISNLFKESELERYKLKHPYVGTEHLMLAILKNDEEMKNFLKKYDLTYDKFRKELIRIVGESSKYSNINLYTPMLKKIINDSVNYARENNNGIVLTRHLLISLLEEGEGIAIRIIMSMGINIHKLYDELCNEYSFNNKKLEVMEVGTLLNEVVDLDEVVVGRDKEIEEIIEILLRKKKSNPLLLGDAGVGKTAIVEELVRRILRKEVPESLYNAKIISLDMGSLVSGTKYRGEFEEKLTKIIKEVENNSNIILFIDEIHSMVSAGGAEGAITAGDIFKPALARGRIKVIGATTEYEYNKFFSSDEALRRRFEKVFILEPNNEETKDILNKVKNEYEIHHNVIINEDVLDSIVKYTNKFITNKKNPDKSIDFLDSVCSKVRSNLSYNLQNKNIYKSLEELEKKKSMAIKENNYDMAIDIYNEQEKLKNKVNNKSDKCIIKESDVLEVLENKTNMIFNKDKMNFLDSIEKEVNSKLYGMDNVVKDINNLIYTNLVNKEGFLKVFIEGSEYLGKTTLVDIIAKNIPKCKYLKIDLNEYQSEMDITKLIGTSKGYVGYDDEHLFNKITNNFTIILFDNYHVAHKITKKLIKNILKNKYIIDNKGNTIYFNNTFIFIIDDTLKTNLVGFKNNSNNTEQNDIYNLVDKVIKLPNLDYNTLNDYLDSINIVNKDKIIKESDYLNYNYKNISKLISRYNLVVN